MKVGVGGVDRWGVGGPAEYVPCPGGGESDRCSVRGGLVPIGRCDAAMLLGRGDGSLVRLPVGGGTGLRRGGWPARNGRPGSRWSGPRSGDGGAVWTRSGSVSGSCSVTGAGTMARARRLRRSISVPTARRTPYNPRGGRRHGRSGDGGRPGRASRPGGGGGGLLEGEAGVIDLPVVSRLGWGAGRAQGLSGPRPGGCGAWRCVGAG